MNNWEAKQYNRTKRKHACGLARKERARDRQMDRETETARTSK